MQWNHPFFSFLIRYLQSSCYVLVLQKNSGKMACVMSSVTLWACGCCWSMRSSMELAQRGSCAHWRGFLPLTFLSSYVALQSIALLIRFVSLFCPWRALWPWGSYPDAKVLVFLSAKWDSWQRMSLSLEMQRPRSHLDKWAWFQGCWYYVTP